MRLALLRKYVFCLSKLCFIAAVYTFSWSQSLPHCKQYKLGCVMYNFFCISIGIFITKLPLNVGFRLCLMYFNPSFIAVVPSEKEMHLTGVYDLVAVLTHKGRSADSGHYVAWVKQDNG